MNNTEKLREEVNPVFTTAQVCLRINALMGDSDAQKLTKLLGFEDNLSASDTDDEMPQEMKEFVLHTMNRGFSIMVESRFASSSNLILKSGIKNVMDMPCGYTPRGVKFSRSGLRYFGLDLPAVIDAIGPASKEVIGNNDNIVYQAVDATSYTSLRKALSGVNGELFITTEGLLMYFTQSELEEVFHNIRKLLLEFGGKWVTTDNQMVAVHGRILTALGDTTKPMIPPKDHPDNEFMIMDKAQQFVDKMGFNLEKVPLYNYLPDAMFSLKNLSAEQQEAVRSVFKDMYFWIMTARPDDAAKPASEDSEFKTKLECTGDSLIVSASGRLDTITAPELLEKFRKVSEETAFTTISFDMKDMEYISSAGLRVLLLMRKSVEDNDHFELRNMSPSVRDIIETAGFDNLIKK